MNKTMQNLTIDLVCTKGPIYPVLIDFENGYPKEDSGITCAVVLQDTDRSRTVATEVSEQVYAGREKKEDSGKTLILARNRKTGKTRLIEIGQAELKPFTNEDFDYLEQQESTKSKLSIKKHKVITSCNKAIQTKSVKKHINGNGLKRQKSNRSKLSMNLSTNNNTEVGSYNAESYMSHKRNVSVEQFRNGTAVINNSLSHLKIDNNNIHPPKAMISAPNALTLARATAPLKRSKAVHHSNDFFVPPYNRNATRAEDMYPLEEIFSTHEYKKIYSELQRENYAADMHPYVRQLVQDKILSPRLTVLAVYASELIKHKQNKKAIGCCSETLAHIFVRKLKKLSEQKCINGLSFCDRKVYDSIVLLLIINNFKLKLRPLCAALQLSDVEKKICLIGASVISIDGDEMMQLKSPLNQGSDELSACDYSNSERSHTAVAKPVNIEFRKSKLQLSMDESIENENIMESQEKNYNDVQTVTEQVADLDLYILPRDRESTEDSDTLQQHESNTLKMSVKSNKHNERKRKISEDDVQTEIVAMENKNQNNSLRDKEENVGDLGLLQYRNDYSNSERSHTAIAKPVNLEFWKSTLQLSMDESVENENIMESQEKINNDVQTVTEQVSIADLDLYILPRDRESTEDDSEILQQHESNTLKMSMKSNKHNERKRKISEDDVQTETVAMENKNLNNSLRDKEENVGDLGLLQYRNDYSNSERSHTAIAKPVNIEFWNPTLQLSMDESIENENIMESQEKNYNDVQTVTEQVSIADLDLYILPRDRESTEDDSETLQQHESNTLTMNMKSNKHNERKRKVSEDDVQTETVAMENKNQNNSLRDKEENVGNLGLLQFRNNPSDMNKNKKRQITKDVVNDSEEMENRNPNVTANQLDTVHDENSLHDLYIFPRHREANECDPQSFQQQPDSNGLVINKKSKKHEERENEKDNTQIDEYVEDHDVTSDQTRDGNRNSKTYKNREPEKDNIQSSSQEMENGYHNVTADQTHNGNRNSKTYKNREQEKDNIQSDSEQMQNGNYNVTADQTHDNNVDYVYIPPINKEATKVEDVYPIDEILSEDEYKKIHSEITGVEYELNAYVQSVVKGKPLSPKCTVLALYATELIKLLHCRAGEIMNLSLVLCSYSQTLDKILLKYFTTFQTYTNVSLCYTRLMRAKTEPLRNKIICHIIVFMLILGEFKLELEPLYRALKQKSLNCEDIKNIVPLLGASIVDSRKKKFIQLSLPLRLKSLLDRRKLLKQYYVPPVNSKASRVEDIYPVEKILSEYEYEKIYSELQNNYDVKHLHPYIKSLIQFKTLSPKLTVLAMYASDLLKFNQVRRLTKPLVISKHSETLNGILIREFTEITKEQNTGNLKRIRSPTLCDKLLCHVTVLALILNNFEVELEPLRACCPIQLKVHLKVVGATVVDSEDGKMLQLKLPKVGPPTINSENIPKEANKTSKLKQSLKGATLVLRIEMAKGNAAQMVHYNKDNDEHSVDFYIPPINREACEIGEIYPVDKILSQSQYKKIYLELQKSGYAKDLHPYVKSLVEDRNLSPNFTVLAVYASELIKFLNYIAKDIRYMKTLCCYSTTLDNIMKKEFTVVTKYCREPNVVVTQRCRTQPMRDKLLCHLLVFLLILNDFKLELEPLYAAIKVGRIHYAQFFSLIGAKVENADGLEFRHIPGKKQMATTRKSAKF